MGRKLKQALYNGVQMANKHIKRAHQKNANGNK